MTNKINIVCEDILILLHRIREPLTLRQLELYLNESKDIILLSLGWLIREGVITVEYKDSNYIICYITERCCNRARSDFALALGRTA